MPPPPDRCPNVSFTATAAPTRCTDAVSKPKLRGVRVCFKFSARAGCASTRDQRPARSCSPSDDHDLARRKAYRNHIAWTARATTDGSEQRRVKSTARSRWSSGTGGGTSMRRPISPVHWPRGGAGNSAGSGTGPTGKPGTRAFWVSFGHPPPQESPACTAVSAGHLYGAGDRHACGERQAVHAAGQRRYPTRAGCRPAVRRRQEHAGDELLVRRRGNGECDVPGGARASTRDTASRRHSRSFTPAARRWRGPRLRSCHGACS